MRAAISLATDVLDAVLGHVREGHPSEVCGILVGPADRDGVCDRAHRLANVQDRFHQLDPEQFPRTSRTAYRFNDMEHLKLLKAAEADGRTERVIYHSHIETGAYFSDEDVAQALWEGQPRFPGVDYLVVGTKDGKPLEANLYRFENGAFAKTAVSLPDGARS